MAWVRSIIAIVCSVVVSAQSAQPSREPPGSDVTYKRMIAICVGVRHFEGEGANTRGGFGVPDLKYTERDAAEVAKVLRDKYGFKQEDVRELTGRVTRGEILAALEDAKKAGEDDIVIFYYSGHGLKLEHQGKDEPVAKWYGFLAPGVIASKPSADTPQGWGDVLVSMDEVVRTFKSLKARHSLVLLDCCFSGFAAVGKGSSRIGQDDIGAYRRLMEHQSWAAITAGTEKEEAFELDDKKQSAFTWGVLETLKSRAGEKQPFSSMEFFVDVRQAVLKLRDSEGRQLSPQFRPLKVNQSAEGELVLIPSGAEDVVVAINKPPKREKRYAVTSRDDVDRTTRKAQGVKSAGKDPARDSDLQEEYRVYNERAAAGDENAMAMKQYMLSQGIGTARDEKAAYRTAQQAAAVNEDVGKQLLAQCLAQGIGVPKNERAAKQLVGPELAAKLISGQHVEPQDVLGVVFGAAAANGAGRNGNAGKAAAGATLLQIFANLGQGEKDVKSVQDAMSNIEKRGRRLREHYSEMVTKNDFRNDKTEAMSRAWLESLPVLEGFAKGTEREADIVRAAAGLRESLKALRTASKDKRKNAMEKAIEDAEGAVVELRKAVGEAPPSK
ncbi:hypothetical protein PHYC_03671 [Phycisphaerales bacterium]|nr:hypothetical protein PHYC_03671 [Phycisphaerales bacterium]